MSVSHLFTILCNARCDTAAHAVNITPYIIPPQTKTEPPLPLNNTRIGKTHSPTTINSLVSVEMAKVKPTFIGKQNQIPISMSELQVTAAPIPPSRSMTSGENLTEVWSVHMNRLNVLSQPISDSLWMNTTLSSGCCCSQMPVT